MRGAPPYQNRQHAGQVLGQSLVNVVSDANVLVLGLPRGGIVVAYEVAHALQAELDVFLVRKLGMPGDEEFAIGAIAAGGTRVLNEDTVRKFRVSQEAIERVVEREQRELERRERLYREGRPASPIRGRTVVLVDDGLATGSTMMAACRALRVNSPRRIVVAVPVASVDACDQIRQFADEVVCTMTPHPFVAIGPWYENFAQTTDEEVRELLERASREIHSSSTSEN